MKTVTIFLILLLAAGLIGCGRQPEPRHIVILPDVSGSIERQAAQQVFKAIDELVSQLHRGDKIAVIPILDDAQAEASGRIIRFEVPRERKAYDADLRDFRRKLSASLEEMQSNAAAHPGSKTDILGAVELAEQEFQLATGQSKKLLIILSDFIQEDNEINFLTDKHFENIGSVQRFAQSKLADIRPNLQGARVYMGLLRSSEYIHMNKSRRNAIQSFWIEFFKDCGTQAKFMTDGSALLPSAAEY